jgi:hypothetical protein
VEDHLSTQQVGWVLGRSSSTVREKIQDGEIRGVVIRIDQALE